MASTSKRPRTEYEIKCQIDTQRKPLRKSRFGVYFCGQYDGKEVTIKRVQIVKLQQDNREEEALRKLQHPNILLFYTVEQDQHFKYFVFEFYLGSVQHFCSGKYSDEMPSEIDGLFQMASGLRHIHSQNFIHRDIRPENILICRRSDSPGVLLKISEFGFCKAVNEGGSGSMSGVHGTCRWLAPELLPFLEQNCINQRHSISSDVFALGCVFYCYLTKGQHPFGQEIYRVMARIVEGDYELNALRDETLKFHDTIENMIRMDPVQRIKINTVCERIEELKGLNSAETK